MINKLSYKDKNEWQKHISKSISENKPIICKYEIPDAADNLIIYINMNNSIMSVGMEVDAPKERKTIGGKINWLSKYLKNKKVISPNDNRGVYLSNTGEEQENSRQFASVLQIIISFIGLGTLVAGVIGISNIMVFVVKERTKEIGIRKAIGASPRSIISMILQESIFITMISGYAGLVIAILILNSIGVSLMEK